MAYENNLRNVFGNYRGDGYVDMEYVKGLKAWRISDQSLEEMVVIYVDNMRDFSEGRSSALHMYRRGHFIGTLHINEDNLSYVMSILFNERHKK